jgi:hypothetical protein
MHKTCQRNSGQHVGKNIHKTWNHGITIARTEQ